jgi:hypothetical protein
MEIPVSIGFDLEINKITISSASTAQATHNYLRETIKDKSVVEV